MGQAEERERILALAARMPDWWCLRADAAPSDADRVLRQNLLLQRAGALNRELKLAERSLADSPQADAELISSLPVLTFLKIDAIGS